MIVEDADTMNDQASGSDAMASIGYLLDRADSCRRKARRSSDETETAELLRTADLFTSLARRVAGGEEAAP